MIKSYTCCLYFIIYPYIFMCGSESTKLLKTDPMRIRIHSTDFCVLYEISVENFYLGAGESITIFPKWKPIIFELAPLHNTGKEKKIVGDAFRSTYSM